MWNKLQFLYRNHIFIFSILLVVIYFDISFFDFVDVFGIELEPVIVNFILGIFVSLFIYVTISIISRINIIYPDVSIFKISFANLKKIVYVYNIFIFSFLILLLYQIVFENSYDAYIVYFLVFSVHIFALFFSLSGTIKFFQWLKIGKEKLSIIYMISFAAFSLLIIFSFIYNISEISKVPITITATNYYKELQTTSFNLSSIYKFYISTFIFSFCAIWTSTFFLFYDYISKSLLKLLGIMLIPMVFFLINLFPITLTSIIYLVSIYPFLFPLYAILSTLTFFIGPVIFSIAIFLMIKNTNNQNFKSYLLPLAYGLFLVFVSNQTNLFSQILYPPFGLVSLLFSGLSLYLIFIGFYSSSIYITRNYSFAKTFVDRVYQFEFFKNIAKSELEKEVNNVFKTIQKNNEFQLNEKNDVDELNKEEITKLIDLVQNEIKNRQLNRTSSGSS
jgi:hypothetical protein